MQVLFFCFFHFNPTRVDRMSKLFAAFLDGCARGSLNPEGCLSYMLLLPGI